ncbi:MAG: S-methyl-5-thioribose-1-phosphate isomerase [archaeon]
MKIDGTPYRTIWLDKDDERTVCIIDQRTLPHELIIERILTVRQMEDAIRDMHLRGAPLIGAAAAFGMYLAAIELGKDVDAESLKKAGETLLATRPTAVNLRWAVERQLETAADVGSDAMAETLRKSAELIAEKSVEECAAIGQHGLELIKRLAKNGKRINIMTHCNAGWLACVDHGTATAPIYAAHDAGIPVHVWVSETRPRNQGARLTAWELNKHGVPYTLVTDSACGHLMQNGEVDMVIVGSDRTTANGDVANKIGTYLKALAANAHDIPFYVALPGSTIDWKLDRGIGKVPIEDRDGDEVRFVQGRCDGKISKVLICPEGSETGNPAFDVTPAKLVTAIITEKGVCDPDKLDTLYPERGE